MRCYRSRVWRAVRGDGGTTAASPSGRLIGVVAAGPKSIWGFRGWDGDDGRTSASFYGVYRWLGEGWQGCHLDRE
jgi:hypothetical protein